MKKGKRGIAMAVVMATMLTATIAVAPFTAMAATTNTADTTVTFTAGELALNSAPTIGFGTQALDGITTNFTASSATPVLAVNDATGSGAGWKVTAALSKFQTGAADSLAGATLTLGNAAVTGTGTVPTAGASIVLASDGTATSAVNAATDAGLGVSDTTWTAADVSLNVPVASQKVGAHTATLTWALSSTPV